MLRVTTVMTGVTGAPYYNQLYFEGDTPGEADAAAAAVRLFWGNCSNAMAAALDGQVLPEVEFVDVATGQVTGVEQTSTTPFAGSAIGEELPHANQGLVRLLTNDFVNGRRLRGRVFIPAPTEAQASGGVPSAAYIGFLEDGIADLLDLGTGAGGLVVYSPTHRVRGIVASGSVWTTNYAVQRSRRD